MTDRKAQITNFVRRAGADIQSLRLIAGDASNRVYYRLQSSGQSLVLMDASLRPGESLTPFKRIAKFLESVGLSAPQILDSDDELGFLLLEDLGDDLFARLMNKSPELQTSLYQAASSVLLHMQKETPPDLSKLDSTLMASQSMMVTDWYCERKNNDLSAELERLVRDVLKPLDDRCTVLIHRDFHAENLLWLPERTGVKRVGVLDFQDAMIGHPCYDLVSILQDARRDVPQDIAREVFLGFVRHKTEDKANLVFAYHALGLQRNLRILGIFARLSLRDGKRHYVDFIPRVWGYIEHNLQRLNAHDLQDLIKSEFPLPTNDFLTHLRTQSA